MADLTLGGKDGGNVVMGAVYGGPFVGTAVWEFPKTYDPAKNTAVLPHLAEWTGPADPLVFLAPQDTASAKAGAHASGRARVKVLETDAQGDDVEIGVQQGVAVAFVTPPKPGDTVKVAFLLARDQ